MSEWRAVSTVAPTRNLNERVYQTLRSRILARDPGPGAKLSQHELAAELGVSRSPVHHALTRLVTEGLLTVKARRGYFVTPVTERAVRDGYELRLALERHAARRAMGHVDVAGLARFRELLDRTAVALSHEEWDAANTAFHEHQVDLAGNATLSNVYHDLSVNLMMQVVRAGRVEASEYLTTEHRSIVTAYEQADEDAAFSAIETHVATGLKIALDALERVGGAF
ncbi:MAG: GntR family transcriptional regulator [Thermoleophilia bacterium]|nr:GntR family transcriptional regulator [Thermoleophilia bacterium]